MKAYCVKCKAKREIKNEEDIYVSEKYRVIRGKCSVCSEGISKILTEKGKNARHRK